MRGSHGAAMLGLVAVLAVVGCSSDDSDDSDDATSSVPATAAAEAAETTAAVSATTAAAAPTTADMTAPPDTTIAPPTGDPILIGVTAPTNSPIFDAAEMLETTAAAAEYVNNELGGIAGRPIELVACETSNTPESVLGCASELLSAEPLVIIGGPDLASPAALETYASENMPLIGGAAFTPQEFNAPNRVLFQGWSASLFPGMAHFAVTELGAENIVGVSFDDPTNQVILQAFMDPVMERQGLPKLQFVGTPASAPDFTAPLATAVSAGADAILAFGLPCEPIMQAYAGLGTDIPMVLPDNCIDPSILASVGDAAEGMYFVVQYDSPTLSPDDPETQTYQHAIDTYSDGEVRETSIGLAGFASIVNLHDVLDDMDPAAIRSESVLAEFKSIDAGPNLLIDGDFNCAAPPVPSFASLCNVSAVFARYEGGELVQLTEWAGASELWG